MRKGVARLGGTKRLMQTRSLLLLPTLALRICPLHRHDDLLFVSLTRTGVRVDVVDADERDKEGQDEAEGGVDGRGPDGKAVLDERENDEAASEILISDLCVSDERKSGRRKPLERTHPCMGSIAHPVPNTIQTP